ncbi:MAG TPA: hypothetical protein VFS20_21310 [Longimicrobium sp.]|nr:hypothetical protein [Longimicrobium sp.]
MKLRSAAVMTLAVLAAACADGPSASDTAARDTRDLALDGPRADVQAGPQLGGLPTVLRFRSIEDPEFPADRSVCTDAGFTPNVYLGASLWSEAGTASSGRIVNNSVRRIGRATACVRITDPTFPPGLPQQFYARFDTPEGTFTARGACTLVSNDVPEPGLVLAGCHLKVVDGPPFARGGVVTSLSVFNPRGLPGYNTGSEWTLQFYPQAS